MKRKKQNSIEMLLKYRGSNLEAYAVLGKLADIDKKLELIEQRLRNIETKLDIIQGHKP